MIRYGMHATCLLIGGALVGAAGCLGPGGVLGSDQNPDTFLVGSINVTTTTTGSTPDPDGYVASLDEARTEPIDVNGAVTFYPLPAGTYGVLLDGMDGGCHVANGPNPQYVVVKPDSTVESHFDVSCP